MRTAFAQRVVVPGWLLLLVALAIAVSLGASMFTLGMRAARADVPDSRPSVVDSTHTLYGCYLSSQLTAYKNFYLLDKSQGGCPSGAGWREVTFAPVVPQTP